MVGNNDEISLDDLFSRDDDELLELLGQDLIGAGAGFGPADASRYRRIAAEWLARHGDELRSKVCGSGTAQAVTDEKTGDQLADAAVVTDAIMTMLGHPSASIVAVILVRRGLARFCSGESPT
jgi:hypothetical protein